MDKITATNNDTIKYLCRLQKSSSFRKEKGEFVLEGARVCSDAAKSGIVTVRCFVTESALSKYESYISVIEETSCKITVVSTEAADRISDTESSQGVFCLCRIPEREVSIDPEGKYIALENIQDPSNLGAICRTSEAIGITGLIVSGGCDVYNPKALRAAMGSSLRLDILKADDVRGLIEKANSMGMLTLASVPDSTASDIRTVSHNKGIICFIGNEGNGLSEEVKTGCSMKVTIPMKGRAESFNASVAAAILAWEITK